MKKSLILLLMCISFTVIAQDVIFTKNGEEIKAKIQELTETHITYKLFDYQDGENIVLHLANVQKIIWQTGLEEVFDIGQNMIDLDFQHIDRIGYNSFLLRNKTILDSRGFEEYLRLRGFDEVWDKYISGQRQLRIGSTMLIAGGVAEILGSILTLMYFFGNADESMRYAGIAISAIGGIASVVGLPMTIIGGCSMASAMRTYNSHARQKNYQTRFHVGFTGNGIGLTLRF